MSVGTECVAGSVGIKFHSNIISSNQTAPPVQVQILEVLVRQSGYRSGQYVYSPPFRVVDEIRVFECVKILVSSCGLRCW